MREIFANLIFFILLGLLGYNGYTVDVAGDFGALFKTILQLGGLRLICSGLVWLPCEDGLEMLFGMVAIIFEGLAD